MSAITVHRGLGIAAPQVGISERFFIMVPDSEPFVIINPRLLDKSSTRVKDWEGCLSIPGIRGKVPRYKSIVVEFMTTDGETVKAELKGWPARIFQHELDHLDGIVFLDRLESTRDVITEREYSKLFNKKG